MKMTMLAMVGALTLAAASGASAANDGPGLRRVEYVRDRPPTVYCSTKFGCEIILQPGERLRIGSIIDDRWVTKVEDDGSGGTAPRILIAPTLATEVDENGKRVPLRTSLKMLTSKPREYVVELVATSRYEENRLGFTYHDEPAVVVTPPTPAPIAVVREAPAISDSGASIDPAAVDFGWAASGDAAVRCVGRPFSAGNQLWCQLPESLHDKPAAYQQNGKALVPIAFHFVNRFLVIDSLVSPVAIVLGGNPSHTATIARARE